MSTGADILLVEDDEDLSEVLADLLGDCGYTVAKAMNGKEALLYLESNTLPELILLDWMMPVMDGEEFLARRAGKPALAAVAVFLLSARGEPPDSMVALGIRRVFRKPLVFQQLHSAIQSVLNR